VREQSRLQAQIEIKRIEEEHRKELIEVVRLLVKEGYISNETSAKIVTSVLTGEPAQDFQHQPEPKGVNRSQHLPRCPLDPN